LPFAFENYVLDPDRRELTRGSEVISIGPQVFDLLLYLLRNRDRVASKDDLLDAVWGGRIVSESTLTSHINAVRKAIGDTGAEQRLIRTIARKGLRFVGEVREETASGPDPEPSGATNPAPALILPDKPSIAALPFHNLSGDPEQEYFADGVVEDITAALSRIRWLFVVARNSSFTYKGRIVDVKQVGRELGVRYILEGSVRKAANRIRITGQLIDATSGTHIWADRFEGTVDDIFDLQDQITTSVVGAISPELERAEIDRAKRKPTENLDGYDFYLRGMAHFHRGTRDAIDQALPLFYEAIRHDPDYASAYGMAAWCHFWRKINGWMTDRAAEMTEGARLARRAVELGPDDAVALTRGGHALGHFGGDLDSCMAMLDRALVLNPNLAAAWYLGGFQRVARGQQDAAIAHFAHAMRLSPLDPEMVRMEAGTALAHLLARRFDLASSWGARSLSRLPSFLLATVVIAASHALAHRMDEAQQAMQHLQRLDPALRISNLKDWLALKRREDRATLAEGLGKAGLPE